MDPTCREYLDAVVSAANKGDQFAQAILPTVNFADGFRGVGVN